MENLESNAAQPQKWLVLIGIDFYMPGGDRHDAAGNSLSFGSLNGCVQDVRSVEEYFKTQLKVDPSHIVALTSTKSKPGSKLPVQEEPRYWPTYENIVNLLKKVTKEAKTGDLVYIHYSGHGARVKTSYPNLKGVGGYDEAIAPHNIGCGGQYLRDVELAILLDAMVKKGLILTVVLDCCHSGGATRDGNTAVARGIDGVDETVSHDQRRQPIPVPPGLTESLKKSYRSIDRELWWDPQGYELIAACRLHEKANEDLIEGQWHGVLTYHLLLFLKSGGLNLTHGMLHRRLQVQITQDWNGQQTPVFSGKSNRYFFGSEEAGSFHTHTVKKVEGNTLILDAGKAHGVMVNSEYAIYPWNELHFSDSSKRPKARVTKVFELDSTAKLEFPAPDVKIEPGFQALPLKSLVLKLAVKLFPGTSTPTGKGLFNKLEEELRRNAQDSPVQLISDSESTAKYHIGVDFSNNFTLLDTSNEPISNFPQSTNPKQFLHNLRHLARYEMFRELKNLSEPDSLKEKYFFEIEGFDPATCGATHSVRDKSSIAIKFTNKTGVPLNITIFNFQSSLWCIEKVFPPPGLEYETVLNNDYKECEFEMLLSENWSPLSPDQIDCFKVFITQDPTSFSALELPELGPNGARLEPGSTRGENDLDALLAELDVGDRKARLARSSQARRLWATSEVEVRTVPDESHITLSEGHFTDEDHREISSENHVTDYDNKATPGENFNSRNEESHNARGNNPQKSFNPWPHVN
ncbi:uncharacterized protein LAJ45_05111 [Morchella importuna]|uniref:uncharacterized protein n=1 Tax=Morchella importuna TaxID=1174673 RepID=UPI001E8CA83F|nr:uncharacterized protein LAJ45_05111 [Morchella importuna]KAH8150929.1 hypothetical protein LAJ45_05111 [Morchella importuna]